MMENTLFLFLVVLQISLSFCASDNAECRNLLHKDRVFNKTLIGHVIANVNVGNERKCNIKCFLNPKCISVNYNLKELNKPNCQLSSSDGTESPEDLYEKAGIIFNAFENHCIGVTCPLSNMTCQTGFGLHGYRCACPECFRGNHCNTFVDDTVLAFPEKSITHVVVIEEPFTTLTSFTISMWAQVKTEADTTKMHTLISYATKSSYNEILLMISKRTFYYTLKNSPFRTPVMSLDNEWHQYAATWESSTGAMIVYIDGHVFHSTTIASGRSINKGALVLGQEQDTYIGGYVQSQSFQGNLTSVNMWDRVLTSGEVAMLAKKCPSGEGNLIKWKDIIPYRNERVRYYCGSSCFS